MHEPAWFRWARVIVLTLLGLFAIAPVYVMLTASLKPLPDVEGAFRWIPSHLTFSPFIDMWQTIPLLTRRSGVQGAGPLELGVPGGGPLGHQGPGDADVACFLYADGASPEGDLTAGGSRA